MLFYLDKNEKTKLRSVKSTVFKDVDWTEKDLENLISKNITTLIPENQLMVLFQERPYDEAADIFALDINGILYIFELKRWKANQEHILQVLRYGQVYGQYSYEQLQDLLRKYRKSEEIDLAKKHFEYFKESRDEPLKPHEFNKNQNFVVITNGTDLETLNAIKYWKDKGLRIDSIPYRVYKISDHIIFEFNPYNPQNEVLLEEEQGFFIVNTNITWSDTDFRDMLDQSKAAAYGSKKWGIYRIKNGDSVFLYHNAVGVVAFGKAIGKPFENSDNDEVAITLKLDWKIDPITEVEKAVRPWEINRMLKSQYAFRQTIFSIQEEMAEAIISISKTKK